MDKFDQIIDDYKKKKLGVDEAVEKLCALDRENKPCTLLTSSTGDASSFIQKNESVVKYDILEEVRGK